MVVRINRNPPDPDATGFTVATAPDHYNDDDLADIADAVIDVAEGQKRSDYVIVMREGVTFTRIA